MKYIFIILLAFCACNKNPFNRLSSKARISSEISQLVANRLKDQYGLMPCGTGAQMMDEIKMLALSFEYPKSVDIQTGRKLLVSGVEDFLSTINSNEQIRPYLIHYPFQPKNILFEIYLQNPDRSQPNQDSLHVLVASDGILKYKIKDPKSSLYKTIYSETFEEAVNKLHAETILQHSA